MTRDMFLLVPGMRLKVLDYHRGAVRSARLDHPAHNVIGSVAKQSPRKPLDLPAGLRLPAPVPQGCHPLRSLEQFLHQRENIRIGHNKCIEESAFDFSAGVAFFEFIPYIDDGCFLIPELCLLFLE